MGKVVFVEDDPTIRKMMQAALRNSPHEIHFATNGREGLALVESVRPHCVFTDVSMPQMDGLQLADAIRAKPELASVQIVFVTASLQREQIERYLAHGAVAYLGKPFTMTQLREHVDRLVPV